jgi:hypothetical protein
MANTKREILILKHSAILSDAWYAQEAAAIDKLVTHTEHYQNLTKPHELIDLNKYKIYQDYFTIRTFFRTRAIKPFVFLFCKN